MLVHLKAAICNREQIAACGSSRSCAPAGML